MPPSTLVTEVTSMKRLIYTAMLTSCFALLSTASAQGDNALPLFNGKDLDGWVVEGKGDFKDKTGKTLPVWSVKDGKLFCDGNGYGFLRYNKKEFADFALHVEYRMIQPKGSCNSGIGIRTV